MNTTTAYTPLECLLLFQSLAEFGTEPDTFARISDLLRNNALVKDGETYDPDRLTVNALQELYTDLVREELKAEGENGDGQDAGQTASRKRKLQSPRLKEAGENKKDLSHHVDRLYARYRNYMVRAIREDEKRYAAVQQEITEIERGEWDEKILKEDGASANNKNGLSPAKEPEPATTNDPGPVNEAAVSEVAAEPPPEESKVHEDKTVPQEPEIQKDVPKDPVKVTPSPLPSPRPGSQSGGLAITDVLNSQDAPPTSSHRVPEKRESTSRGRKESQSATPLPPLTTSRPGSNGPHGPSPLQPGHQQQGGAWQWEPPYQAVPPHQPPTQHPPAYPVGGNYPQFNSPQYPPQPYPPPQRGSFSTPHGLPPPHPNVSSSPVNGSYPHHIHLPPPNSIHRPPGSPSMPLDALADIAGQQQYRAPSGSPATQQQSPLLPPPPAGYTHPYPPQPSPQQSYPPQQWDGRSPNANGPPPQWNQPYAPAFQPPPQHYPFNPQYQQQPPQFPHCPDLIAPENRQYNSPYNVSQGPRPQIPFQAQNKSTPKPRPSAPNTPISRGPPRLITGTGTKWTPTPTASTPRPEKMPEPPQVEPLSPVLKPAKAAAVKKSTKKQNLKTQTPQKLKAPAPRRGGAQRGRAGSTASSVVGGGSYRSQSVMSHADELSIDNELPPARRVKEEVATPRPMEETGDITADEGTGKRPKNVEDVASPRPTTKRKRAESVEVREPPPPPTHVLWTRAFPKISASAIEAITGHRIANTFAAPVKERDAPGYSHLILRPQDLKSIKSAIIAGNKAAAAVAPDDQNQASSIWLPISEDLIPPKGIINYAQLEKELMRMFANAIMFNADPDRGLGKAFHNPSKFVEADSSTYEFDENGVVKDTRAMFLDVEKTIGDLRAAERRSEETKESIEKDTEVDELATEGEATGSVAKRRRKA